MLNLYQNYKILDELFIEKFHLSIHLKFKVE